MGQTPTKKTANKKTHVFDRLAKRASIGAGHGSTFICALFVIAIWAITGPIFNFNDTWQLVINTGTTIVTFLMVFLIQNTQNRESSAVQIKLDEIIRVIREATNDIIDIEDMSQDELEAMREKYVEMAHSRSSQSQSQKSTDD
ncbi:MAG TPA: low affinity iron permease family protein [Candidatus Obscuribacterales bacterium]